MKKFIFSLLAILLALGLMGGAFAALQDTETSTGNTFTAGTLDLELADPDEGFPPVDKPNDSVSATWTMSCMIPGSSIVGPFPVNLRNIGCVQGNHVEISFSHTINDDPDVESDTNKSSSPADMAKWMEITAMDYNGTNWKTSFVPYDTARDPNNNGFLDLDDVTWPSYADEGGFLDNLAVPILPYGTRTLHLQLKFNAGATNDIQGDTLTTTVTFTLNQDASQ